MEDRNLAPRKVSLNLELTIDFEMAFKAVFNVAIDGIVIIDRMGIIQLVNPSGLKLFGYQAEDVVGKNVSILMPSPDREKHDKYIHNYQQTGEKKIIGIGREVIGKKADGSQFPLRLSVSEFFIEEQRFFVGILHDLTAQEKAENDLKSHLENMEEQVELRTSQLNDSLEKLEKLNKTLNNQIEEKIRAEHALLESQKLYSVIAHNFPNGTINVFDRDLKYVFSDGKELRALGIKSEDLVGKKISDRLPAAIRTKAEEELRKVFDGISNTFELEYKGNLYVLTAVPLEDTRGKINQILVVEVNVTEQKRAEEDMKKALEKEKELNQLKSRFVSMASHEFRTPLTSINSSSSLIGKYLEMGQPEQIKRHVERIRQSVGNLTSILNDFLSLSKLEEGRIHPTIQEVCLPDLIGQVLEEMEGLKKEGQSVELSGEGMPLTVVTDPNFVRNILINLLSNAIKYSPESSEIQLHVHGEPRSWSMVVVDKGIGIPEDEQARLFDRFFRASNAFNLPGTGLGLGIVKRYVELLGGRISFQSKPEIGTTFKVVLPIIKH